MEAFEKVIEVEVEESVGAVLWEQNDTVDVLSSFGLSGAGGEIGLRGRAGSDLGS